MRGDTGAVILAAGGSRRFGAPKQFLQIEGKTLVQRCVATAEEAGCSPIVVVAGAEENRLAEVLHGTSARLIANRDWELGLGSSIRAGVGHLLSLEANTSAIVMLACDQPLATAELILKLIEEHNDSGADIVACTYAHTRGIPALFGRAHFEALLGLPDESGAKPLLSGGERKVATIAFAGGEIDIDTTADFERLMKFQRNSFRI